MSLWGRLIAINTLRPSNVEAEAKTEKTSSFQSLKSSQLKCLWEEYIRGKNFLWYVNISGDKDCTSRVKRLLAMKQLIPSFEVRFARKDLDC